ncbi:hypothetical protein T484DRAFT_1895323, partial [Baffinella frigidus]
MVRLPHRGLSQLEEDILGLEEIERRIAKQAAASSLAGRRAYDSSSSDDDDPPSGGKRTAGEQRPATPQEVEGAIRFLQRGVERGGEGGALARVRLLSTALLAPRNPRARPAPGAGGTVGVRAVQALVAVLASTTSGDSLRGTPTTKALALQEGIACALASAVLTSSAYRKHVAPADAAPLAACLARAAPLLHPAVVSTQSLHNAPG